MRKQLIIGFAVAAFFMYFAFRGISWPAMIQTMRSGDVRWIASAIALYCVGYVLRTVRWQILMESIQTIPGRDLFAPMVIGFFANNVLPFRMGEFVRAHVTGNKFHISRTACLATILLERLFDTLSFLSTFIAVALFYRFPPSVEKGAAALGIACFLVIGALVVVLRHEERFHEVLGKLPLKPSWLTRLKDMVANFTHGVSGLKQAHHMAGAMIYSLIIWTIEGTFLFFMARAFSIPLHYPQSFFLLFFMGLSVTLPQAPGYVGTLEFFGVTALALLGIPKEQGLPVILAIHGTQFLFILVLGIWALGSEGLSIGKLMEQRA